MTMTDVKKLLGVDAPATVKQGPSSNATADPLLWSSASEQAQAPHRADASTAAPGPTLDLAGLQLVRSLNGV
jgi:hypothetical protein